MKLKLNPGKISISIQTSCLCAILKLKHQQIPSKVSLCLRVGSSFIPSPPVKYLLRNEADYIEFMDFILTFKLMDMHLYMGQNVIFNPELRGLHTWSETHTQPWLCRGTANSKGEEEVLRKLVWCGTKGQISRNSSQHRLVLGAGSADVL